MSVDLFIKKLPNIVKELIGQEALDNRRSINQETIPLLEDALMGRVGAGGKRRPSVRHQLEDYAAKRSAGRGAAPSEPVGS